MDKLKSRTYLNILQNALRERAARRPRYSQNAFARDLGLSPARMSQVLSGKSGLSVSAAKKITAALELSPELESSFIDSVIASHSRSALQREQALVRLKNSRLQ